MSFRSTLSLLVVASALPVWVVADDQNSGHDMSHESTSARNYPVEQSPSQGGQAAFAAIAEMVSLLDRNPNTDWEKVDIPALRNHLVDMDRLTLQAEVASRHVDDHEIEFSIRGTGQTAQAIANMVPAHAAVVQGMTGWKIRVTDQEGGVVLKVRVNDSSEMTRLRALDFFGFMAIGSHHQEHHLKMVLGQGH